MEEYGSVESFDGVRKVQELEGQVGRRQGKIAWQGG